MRPSEISRSSDSFAISLRTGSKQEITTASGVSSMMMSTPVSVSRVRMFLPSRPIIRPFISSLGRETVVTVMSLVVSGAMRWIVVTRISRAFFSAESCASCSILFNRACASCFASFSRFLMIKSFASCAERPEILSSSLRYISSCSESAASRFFIAADFSIKSFSFFSHSAAFWSTSSSFLFTRAS